MVTNNQNILCCLSSDQTPSTLLSTPNSSEEKVKRLLNTAKEFIEQSIKPQKPVPKKEKECLDKSFKIIHDLHTLLHPNDVTNDDQKEILYLLSILLKYSLSLYGKLILNQSYKGSEHTAKINRYLALFDNLYERAQYCISFEEKKSGLTKQTRKSNLAERGNKLYIHKVRMSILWIKINKCSTDQNTINLALKIQEVAEQIKSIEKNSKPRKKLIEEYRGIGSISLNHGSLASLQQINNHLMAFRRELAQQTTECLLASQDGPQPDRNLFGSLARPDITSLYTATERKFSALHSVVSCKSCDSLKSFVDNAKDALQLWKTTITQSITRSALSPSDQGAFDILMNYLDQCTQCLDFALGFAKNSPSTEVKRICEALKTLCYKDDTTSDDYHALLKQEQRHFENPITKILILQRLLAIDTSEKPNTNRNFFQLFHFLSKNTYLDPYVEEHARLVFLEYLYARRTSQDMYKKNYTQPAIETVRAHQAIYEEISVRYMLFVNFILNNKSHYSESFLNQVKSRSHALMDVFNNDNRLCMNNWFLKENPCRSNSDLEKLCEFRIMVSAFINSLYTSGTFCFMGFTSNSSYAERYVNASLEEVHAATISKETIAEWTLIIENTRDAKKLQTQLKKMHATVSAHRSELYSDQLRTIMHAIQGALGFYERVASRLPVQKPEVQLFNENLIFGPQLFSELFDSAKQSCNSLHVVSPELAVKIVDFKKTITSGVDKDFIAHVVLAKSQSVCHLPLSFEERIQNHHAVYCFIHHILDYSKDVDNFYHLKLYHDLLQQTLTTFKMGFGKATDTQLLQLEKLFFEFSFFITYSKRKQTSAGRILPYVLEFESALGALQGELTKLYHSFACAAKSSNKDRYLYFACLMVYHLNTPFCRLSQRHQPDLLFSMLHIGQWFHKEKFNENFVGFTGYVSGLLQNLIEALSNNGDHKALFTLGDTEAHNLLAIHQNILYDCSRQLLERTPRLPAEVPCVQPVVLLTADQFFSQMRDLFSKIYVNKFSIWNSDTIYIGNLYAETLAQDNFYPNVLAVCEKNIFTINDQAERIGLIILLFDFFLSPDALDTNYRSLLSTLLTESSNLIKKNNSKRQDMVDFDYFYYYALCCYISHFIKHHPSLFSPDEIVSFLSKMDSFVPIGSYADSFKPFLSTIIRLCFSYDLDGEPCAVGGLDSTHDTSLAHKDLSYFANGISRLRVPDEAIQFLRDNLKHLKDDTVSYQIVSATIAFLTNHLHHLPSEIPLPDCALVAIVERVKEVPPHRQDGVFTGSVTTSSKADFTDSEYVKKMIGILPEKIRMLPPDQALNVITFMHTNFNLKSLFLRHDFIYFLSTVFSSQTNLKDEKTHFLAILFWHMAHYAVNHPDRFDPEKLESIKQSAIKLYPILLQPPSQGSLTEKIHSFQEALSGTLVRICYPKTHQPESPFECLLINELGTTKKLVSYFEKLLNIGQMQNKRNFLIVLRDAKKFLSGFSANDRSLKMCVIHIEAALEFCESFMRMVPYTSHSLQTSLLPKKSLTSVSRPAPQKEDPEAKQRQRDIVRLKEEARKQKEEREKIAHEQANRDRVAVNEILAARGTTTKDFQLLEEPPQTMRYTPPNNARSFLTKDQLHDLWQIKKEETLKMHEKMGGNGHDTRMTQFIQGKVYEALAAQAREDIKDPSEIKTETTPSEQVPVTSDPCVVTVSVSVQAANDTLLVVEPANDTHTIPNAETCSRDSDSINISSIDPIPSVADAYVEENQLKFLSDVQQNVSIVDPSTVLQLIGNSLYEPLSTEQKSFIREHAPGLKEAIKSRMMPFDFYCSALEALSFNGNAVFYFTQIADILEYLFPFSDDLFKHQFILYCKCYMSFVFEDFDIARYNGVVIDNARVQLLAILLFPETLNNKSPDVIISEIFAKLSITLDPATIASLSRFLTYHKEHYRSMLPLLKSMRSQELLIEAYQKDPSKQSRLVNAERELGLLQDQFLLLRLELTRTTHGQTPPLSSTFSAAGAAAHDDLRRMNGNRPFP